MIDSHNHLQEPELAAHLPEIWQLLGELGIHRVVVNGTHAGDWENVARMAREHREVVIASFGLHPWYVKSRGADWLERLTGFLDENPEAKVGEIGLDRWIEGHDLDEQLPVFTAQLAEAARRNVAATIHCVQAWGALESALQTTPVPERGFLLHAYGGPLEMAAGFAKRGAYFSFSPYFLHARKATQREVFRHLPLERLLIETDAPALYPPPERNRFPLTDPISGTTINHPGNLTVSLAGLAEIRGMPCEDLAAVLEENFQRLFGN